MDMYGGVELMVLPATRAFWQGCAVVLFDVTNAFNTARLS